MPGKASSSGAALGPEPEYTRKDAENLNKFGEFAKIRSIPSSNELFKDIEHAHFSSGRSKISPHAMIIVQANKPKDILSRSITPLDERKDNQAHRAFVNGKYQDDVVTDEGDTDWKIHISGEKAFPSHKGGKRTRKRKRTNKKKTKRRRRASKRFRRK